MTKEQAEQSEGAAPHSPSSSTAGKRGWHVQRKFVVFASLAGGLISLLGVTRTWISVPPPNTGVQLGTVSVSGTEAASAVMALTVVGLACAIATTISGRVAKYIVGAVQALVGAAIVGFVIPVMADPATAASAKVGKTFGLERVDSSYTLTLWPWVSVLGGALLFLAALVLLSASRGWQTGRRYERTAGGRAVVTESTMDDIDRWDAFTEGDDPTDGEDGIRGARFH